MDAIQFGQFMKLFQDTIKELIKNKGKGIAGSSRSSSSAATASKILIKLPIFKGEPGKNIVV